MPATGDDSGAATGCSSLSGLGALIGSGWAAGKLVTNAVEHGLAERDGTVQLEAERKRNAVGEDVLLVAISDDGVGLPEGPPSEGLGLQIVRTLVTSELSGNIHWEDRTGKGTRVVIELPVAARR